MLLYQLAQAIEEIQHVGMCLTLWCASELLGGSTTLALAQSLRKALLITCYTWWCMCLKTVCGIRHDEVNMPGSCNWQTLGGCTTMSIHSPPALGLGAISVAAQHADRMTAPELMDYTAQCNGHCAM